MSKVTVITNNATVDDTLQVMSAVARREANSTAIDRLLQFVPFRPNDHYGFLKDMFEVLARSASYQLDKPGYEQIKTPDRFLLVDGFGDCDDFSTTWRALFYRLRLLGYFKVVKYQGNPSWAHVYVVAPWQNNKGFVVLDNVLGTFNKEVQYVEHKLY